MAGHYRCDDEVRPSMICILPPFFNRVSHLRSGSGTMRFVSPRHKQTSWRLVFWWQQQLLVSACFWWICYLSSWMTSSTNASWRKLDTQNNWSTTWNTWRDFTSSGPDVWTSSVAPWGTRVFWIHSPSSFYSCTLCLQVFPHTSGFALILSGLSARSRSAWRWQGWS